MSRRIAALVSYLRIDWLKQNILRRNISAISSFMLTNTYIINEVYKQACVVKSFSIHWYTFIRLSFYQQNASRPPPPYSTSSDAHAPPRSSPSRSPPSHRAPSPSFLSSCNSARPAHCSSSLSSAPSPSSSQLLLLRYPLLNTFFWYLRFLISLKEEFRCN